MLSADALPVLTLFSVSTSVGLLFLDAKFEPPEPFALESCPLLELEPYFLLKEEAVEPALLMSGRRVGRQAHTIAMPICTADHNSARANATF